MSRKEDIDNGIWSDPDFEDLSPDATLLYLWSFTNPRCGMAGIYKVSKRAMTESKVPLDRLDETLEELADRGFGFYEDGVLFVRTRVKHLRQKTEQIAKSIVNDLRILDDSHPVKELFMEEYGNARWLLPQLQAERQRTLGTPSGEGRGSFGTEPNVRGSTEGHATLQGKGNGKGSGKGKGKGEGNGLRETRARIERAKAWAAENVPDLPADFVATVYAVMPLDSPPQLVRESVLDAYPSLREDAA